MPSESSTSLTIAGSVTSPSTRRRPPQLGHASTSTRVEAHRASTADAANRAFPVHGPAYHGCTGRLFEDVGGYLSAERLARAFRPEDFATVFADADQFPLFAPSIESIHTVLMPLRTPDRTEG